MKSSTLEFKRHLADCQRRAKLLSYATAFQGNLVAPDGTPLETVFQGALADGEDAQRDQEEASKRMRDLLDRARNKDKSAVDELNELRMEKIDLYVRATSGYASMMYRTVTLKDNEQACIETSYRNPVNVRYIAQDGGSRTVKAVKAKQQVFIDMKQLTSDDVGYQIRDINLGTDIDSQAQATVDIGFDLANKVDLEAYNLLIGGTINGRSYGSGVFGSFNTGSTPLSKTWINHPRINTANLPTTNDYANSALDDAGSATDTGLFRLSVIRLIMKYCAQFGNIFGAPVRPTGAIFIPSSELYGLTLEVKPTGIVNNPVAEGIMGNYIQFDYMGIRWTLIPDVTLPKGRCLPVLNRPVGTMLVKPSMDMEYVETNVRKNWETRAATKVVNFYTVEPDRVYALRIAYNNSPAAQGNNE